MSAFVDEEGVGSVVLVAVGYGVVCISSEDGAGAAEAAAFVAQALGFRLINEEILTRAAVEAGVDQEVVADVERRRSLVLRVLEGLGPASMGMGYGWTPPVEGAGYGQPASKELRESVRSVIEDTATAGEVVIAAHAASLALAIRDDVLRVHVTASTSTRQRRLADSLRLDEKEAARVIKRSDAGRVDYLKRFYGIDAERPTHYDLVVNTDKLTPDDAARLIVAAANS